VAAFKALRGRAVSISGASDRFSPFEIYTLFTPESPHVPARFPRMLETMQNWAESAVSPVTSPPSLPIFSSFASALAAQSSRASGAEDRAPTWDDGDLADDVATLSYERVLRAHAGYKPADWPVLQTGVGGGEAAGPDAIVDEETPQAQSAATAFERGLKSASITIRLSKAECAQLRKRAAEAGLTISAYLRSCTFEAEALRAQVKKALAELRAAASDGKQPAPVPAVQLVRRWWQFRLRASPRSAPARSVTPLRAPGTSGIPSPAD
jgi:predicted DNA binding CopG/RHH family protein